MHCQCHALPSPDQGVQGHTAPVHKIKFGQEQLRKGQAELETARVAHAKEAGRMEERMHVLQQVDASLQANLAAFHQVDASLQTKLTTLSDLIGRGEAIVERLEGLRTLPLPRQAGVVPAPAAGGTDPAASGASASGARPARSRTPRALSKG